MTAIIEEFPKHIFIYALRDPITDDVHYVGQTNHLHRRLKQHLKETDNSKKTEWIRELKKLGLTPSIKVLEKVPPEEAGPAEKKWIHHYSQYGLLKNTTYLDDVYLRLRRLENECSQWKNACQDWKKHGARLQESIEVINKRLESERAHSRRFKELAERQLQAERELWSVRIANEESRTMRANERAEKYHQEILSMISEKGKLELELMKRGWETTDLQYDKKRLEQDIKRRVQESEELLSDKKKLTRKGLDVEELLRDKDKYILFYKRLYEQEQAKIEALEKELNKNNSSAQALPRKNEKHVHANKQPAWKFWRK